MSKRVFGTDGLAKDQTLSHALSRCLVGPAHVMCFADLGRCKMWACYLHRDTTLSNDLQVYALHWHWEDMLAVHISPVLQHSHDAGSASMTSWWDQQLVQAVSFDREESSLHSAHSYLVC